MIRYTAARGIQLLFMLFIASIVIFLIVQNAPGDPARNLLGLSATPAQVAIERHKLGLDASLPHRYAIWLSHAVRLDLGTSFGTGLSVTKVVASAFWYTFRLAIASIVVALVLGMTLGLVATLNRGRMIDLAISAFAAAGLSVPSFATGTVLILVMSVELKVLPSAGAGIPGQSSGEALRFLVMPALTLGVPFSSVLIRYIRVALGEAMGQPYITTARAKGLTRPTVIGHGMRNVLIPLITVAGLQIGKLLAGTVITETVFAYPGLGFLTIQAIQGQDYPVVEGALLFGAAVFLALTVVVDLVYGFVDPRVRVASR